VRYLSRINRAVTAFDIPKIGRSAAVAGLAAKLETFSEDLKLASARIRRARRDQAGARALDSRKIAERLVAGKRGNDPLPTEPAAALAADRAQLETEAASKAVDLIGDELGRAIVADKSDWIERIKKEHEVALCEYAAALATAKRQAALLSESAPALAWLKAFEVIPAHKPAGQHCALVSEAQFAGPVEPTIRVDFSATNARSDLRVSRLLNALVGIQFGKVES